MTCSGLGSPPAPRKIIPTAEPKIDDDDQHQHDQAPERDGAEPDQLARVILKTREQMADLEPLPAPHASQPKMKPAVITGINNAAQDRAQERDHPQHDGDQQPE